ncbi:MAG: hypothetical protein QXX08_00670 [Candidatus Bathyarchaeia archaeon]
MNSFPTIKVEDVEIPKVLIGINSLLGWSHTSVGRDKWIRKYYTPNRVAKVFERCIELGVHGVLGPIWPPLIKAIKIAEKETGRKMTFVSTTIGELKDTEKELKMLEGLYSPVCCIHGSWMDGWPVKDNKFLGLEDYLRMIRENGRIPGIACHNGDRLRMVDEGEYDASLLVTPVNKIGFYMSPMQDSVLNAISKTCKPVIAIKPLAGGRFDEGKIPEWLRWVLDQRGVSAVCIGFMSEEEAEEDITYLKKMLVV